MAGCLSLRPAPISGARTVGFPRVDVVDEPAERVDISPAHAQHEAMMRGDATVERLPQRIERRGGAGSRSSAGGSAPVATLAASIGASL